MSDASFIGITSSDFLQFAGVLLTTTAAFVFLYLASIQVEKLPFIESFASYKPPSWLLPWFASVSLFLLAASASAGLFLRYLHASPSERFFLQQYYEKRSPFEISGEYGLLKDAHITITAGAGNFGVYVNGWRVFASEVNCGLEFLCRTQSDWAQNEGLWTKEMGELPQLWDTYYRPDRLYKLPYSVSIKPWLVEGENFIDIRTSAPGLGECLLQGELDITLQNKQLAYSFLSNGNTAAANADRYGTNPFVTNHNICDRIRLQMTLPKAAS